MKFENRLFVILASCYDTYVFSLNIFRNEIIPILSLTFKQTLVPFFVYVEIFFFENIVKNSLFFKRF